MKPSGWPEIHGLKYRPNPPRKRIPSRSKKRAREAREYAKKKKVFLANNTLCIRCMSWILPSDRTLHHFYGRTGALLSWVPGFRMACATCHTWIEQHRNESVVLGYRAPDNLWNRPSLVIPK